MNSASASPTPPAPLCSSPNFWQDVARDLEKGRIYIPLDVAAAHGLSEADLVDRRFDDRYIN